MPSGSITIATDSTGVLRNLQLQLRDGDPPLYPPRVPEWLFPRIEGEDVAFGPMEQTKYFAYKLDEARRTQGTTARFAVYPGREAAEAIAEGLSETDAEDVRPPEDLRERIWDADVVDQFEPFFARVTHGTIQVTGYHVVVEIGPRAGINAVRLVYEYEIEVSGPPDAHTGADADSERI